MSIKSRFTLLLATLLLLCVGCRDYDPTQEHNPNLGTYFEDGAHFDFSTIGEVQLDIDYGPGLGAKTFVQIFDQYPDENEDVEPLYTTVTDSEGRIQNRAVLPTRVKEVWLVNHHIGMPEYVKCSVSNGRIQYKYESPLLKSAGVTRAGSTPDNTNYRDRVKLVNESKNLYTIVSWDDQFGNINTDANVGIVTTDQTVNSTEYNNWVGDIQKTLWKGEYKPSGDNKGNDIYALGSNVINTKTLEEYEDEVGKKIKVESVSLSFVFIGEWAWNQNVMGYYYYKTNDGEPKDVNSVKKFICLPNASKQNHFPYGGGDSRAYHNLGKAPAYAGESISLLFEKKDGSFTKNFPPGYTIGYFVISNGFRTVKDQDNYKGDPINPGIIDASKKTFFSNENWNADTKKRYLALTLPDGGIIYGLEDSNDNSYDDVLFMIQGTPNEAIDNPSIPTIDPDDRTIYYWDKNNLTYAFEDIWPHGGDYDLNDVVMSHERRVEFDKDKNLRTVEDIFTLAETNATYQDAFAIQLNRNYLAGLKITKGGEDITQSVKHYTDVNNNSAETYILFEDLQQLETGTEYKLTRTFTGSIQKDAFEEAEPKVNPFVISKYTDVDYNAGKMVEIHIPNYGNRTNKAKTDASTGSQYYYVARKDNNTYPFALCLPVKKFIASPEGVCIDQTYPLFDEWVKSNGKNNEDWYLQPGTESK